MSNLFWYVVQVATNMEDRVQSNIINNILNKLEAYKLAGLEDKIIKFKDSFAIENALDDNVLIAEYLKSSTILVPKEKIEEIKNGIKKENERKIFPGYILVRIKYDDDIGILIKKTPKVAGFIGVAKDSKPLPIPQAEVDVILSQVEKSKEKAKYKIEFQVGEKIRVIDGPFIDFNAEIEDVIYEKSRLRVKIQIFGRDTPVELDFGQVEKLN